MEIPKEHILNMLTYVKKLERFKYIHYRDLYEFIDHTNFQIATKVDFKKPENIKGKTPQRQFKVIKKRKDIIYTYESKTGSQYIITTNGDVYRLANHWGAVASCQWTIEGEGVLMESIYITGDWELGVANLSDFKIFRKKNVNKKDIIINPYWINQIKTLIPLSDKLYSLKTSPEFLELPVEEKQFIGESFGKINRELKLI